MKCNRCKKKITDEDREFCWFCIGDLCYECWDEYGHCGHSKADEMNERARKVKQPE